MYLSLDDRRRRTMRHLHDYVARLPVTLTTAAAINEVGVGDPGAPSVVEQLARYDPTVAIRLLYAANHAFYATDHLPLTLASVMRRVGAQAVGEVVGAIKQAPVLSAPQVDTQNLWLHAVQVALIAKQFALRLPEHKIGGDDAYLLGLLHDVGRFVMLAAAPDEFLLINEEEGSEGDDLIGAEIEMCGFDHSTLGWLACRGWNFSDELALVNKLHHAVGNLNAHCIPPRTATLIRLIGLADQLSFLLLKSPSSSPQEWAATVSTRRIVNLANGIGMPIAEIPALIPPVGALSRRKISVPLEASVE